MLKRVNFDEIKTVKCTLEEQETTVTMMRNENMVNIFTSDNTVITKLRKNVEMQPDAWNCYESGRDNEGNVVGYFFTCPKRAISFRSGIKKKGRVFTDEEREQIRQRFKRG